MSDNVGSVGESITIAPYEYSLVWEFVGKGRYLQAAFCKSIAQLYSSKFDTITSKKLSNLAAEGAFLGLLEWCKDIGCRWDESVFESGASGGSVDVLSWLVDTDCPSTKDASICTAAAKGGHAEALKFLTFHGYDANRNTYTAAAESGYLHVIQFAQKSQCSWDMDEVAAAAVRNGHLHILQWLYEMEETLGPDCQFFDRMCESGARLGRMDVLLWSRSVGCGWDEQTCLAAIEGGQLETLKWLVEEGCPWTR